MPMPHTTAYDRTMLCSGRAPLPTVPVSDYSGQHHGECCSWVGYCFLHLNPSLGVAADAPSPAQRLHPVHPVHPVHPCWIFGPSAWLWAQLQLQVQHLNFKTSRLVAQLTGLQFRHCPVCESVRVCACWVSFFSKGAYRCPALLSLLDTGPLLRGRIGRRARAVRTPCK